MSTKLDSAAPPEHDDGTRVIDVFRRAAFNWALSTKKLVEASSALGVNQRVAHTALKDIEHAKKMLTELFVPSPMKGESPAVTAAEVKSAVAGVSSRIKAMRAEELAHPPIVLQPNEEFWKNRWEKVVTSISVHSESECEGCPDCKRLAAERTIEFTELDKVAIPEQLHHEAAAKGRHEHTRDCEHNSEEQWAAYHVAMTAEAPKAKTKKKPLDLSAPVQSKDGKMRWASIDCPGCPSKATERCRKPDGSFREKPHPVRINRAELVTLP